MWGRGQCAKTKEAKEAWVQPSWTHGGEGPDEAGKAGVGWQWETPTPGLCEHWADMRGAAEVAQSLLSWKWMALAESLEESKTRSASRLGGDLLPEVLGDLNQGEPLETGWRDPIWETKGEESTGWITSACRDEGERRINPTVGARPLRWAGNEVKRLWEETGTRPTGHTGTS